MLADRMQPAPRPVFDEGLDALLTQHATLRAVAAKLRQQGLTGDLAASLMELLEPHEALEASFFELPFLSRMPETVETTSAQLHRLYARLTAGSMDAAAGAVFADVLLEHLAAEEAWLDRESEQRRRRILAII